MTDTNNNRPPKQPTAPEHVNPQRELNYRENTAKAFRELRQELGLNQTQLARQLGIVSSYISDIESCRKKAQLEHLAKLKKLFNIDINYFISGEGLLFYDNSRLYDFEAKRKELGNSMIDMLDELLWYLDKSDLTRLAVFNFFKKFVYENAARLEDEIGTKRKD